MKSLPVLQPSPPFVACQEECPSPVAQYSRIFHGGLSLGERMDGYPASVTSLAIEGQLPTPLLYHYG